MQLGRRTEEEKQAARGDKEARRAAEAQRNADEAFWASPIGLARRAFSDGDQLLQLALDLVNTQTYVIPMGKAGTAINSSDPSDILNGVCREGWELINGSFVFLQTGAESRDKFLASGQHMAVQGTVLGYYLFRRNEANRGA